MSNKWQPVSTIPEDRDVLVWVPGRWQSVRIGRKFTRDDGILWIIDGASIHEKHPDFTPDEHCPNFWMPLPENPK